MADTHLSDLFAAYDTFIIGSSGVLTSPDGAFYPGAEDALAGLAEQGKQVIIYDNSSLLPAAHFANPHWRKWADKGFRFYTSFGLCMAHVQQQGYFSYFLFGSRPLPGLIFMPEMTMAEFIYLDIPGLPLAYLRPENLINVPGLSNLGFTASLEPFADFLHQAREQEKVIYCGNPSFADKMLINNHEVLSNRSILAYYRSLGGQVMEFGKPHIASYRQILQQLPAQGKILCIGNSLEADGQGAVHLRQAGYKAASLLIGAENNSEADYSAPAFSLTD